MRNDVRLYINYNSSVLKESLELPCKDFNINLQKPDRIGNFLFYF